MSPSEPPPARASEARHERDGTDGHGDEWLDAQEAARRLGVKPATLYAYVSRGQLRRVFEGRRGRYSAEDIASLAVRGRRARPTRPSDIVVPTAITSITPMGPSYRGALAVELAGREPFEAVAGRLWDVEVPTSWSAAPDLLDAIAAAVPAQRKQEPADRPPVEAGVPSTPLLTMITAARDADPFRDDLRPEAVTATTRRLIATLVRFSSSATSAPSGNGWTPHQGQVRGTEATPGGGQPSSVAAQVASVLTGHQERAVTRMFDAALVLLADHELAASTLAVRVAASARSDIYAAILAGAAVMSGGRHGAASRPLEVALARVAAGWSPEEALAAAGSPGGGVRGFGHPLYPDGDPRGQRLFEMLHAGEQSTLMGPVQALLDVASERELGHPSIDAALAALTHVAGAPIGSGEYVFTIARIAGWVAHALEQYDQTVLLRPRAVYTGP